MVERIKKLVKELNDASDAYYNTGNPIMSDFDWDCMYDELVDLERQTGIVMSNSPTRNVGYEVKSVLAKSTHSHPMLSLGKTKDINDLVEFSKNKDCIMSLKMDGLTVLLTYDNGVLTKAETRGNGEVGEDITHCANVFENIPLTIKDKGHCEFEGEAIITYDDFEKINSKLPEDKKYKNPRNLVSGSVRQLDSSIAAQRHIKFVLWKVPYNPFETMEECFKYALELGFTVVPYVFPLRSGTEYDDYYSAIRILKSIANVNNYPIDGMVVSYNDINYGLSLGMTGHHPRHSTAYKFYNEEVESELINIEWQVGKSGQIVPVGKFTPVEIEGTIVEKASLSNLSILEEKLGRPFIGQKIYVTKRNAVIPWIEHADKSEFQSEYIDIPTTCPICGIPTEVVQENDSKVLMCTNDDCAGKLLGKLSHFVSKNAINVDGLSEATLEVFIDHGWLKSLTDIYRLSSYYKEIVRLEGFGKRSTDKLMDAIEKSRHEVELANFINSLSIPNIGRSKAKDIANHFGNDWKKFMEVFSSPEPYSWSKLEGFASTISQGINKWKIDHVDMVCELCSLIDFKAVETSGTNKLEGKTIVITGKLTMHKNRDELVAKIEANGGKVAGSVSNKTDLLLMNDKNSTSSKANKARTLGIPIVSEQDFINMLGD